MLVDLSGADRVDPIGFREGPFFPRPDGRFVEVHGTFRERLAEPLDHCPNSLGLPEQVAALVKLFEALAVSAGELLLSVFLLKDPPLLSPLLGLAQATPEAAPPSRTRIDICGCWA